MMQQDTPLDQINRNATEEKERCRGIGQLGFSRPLGGERVEMPDCPRAPPSKAGLGRSNIPRLDYSLIRIALFFFRYFSTAVLPLTEFGILTAEGLASL